MSEEENKDLTRVEKRLKELSKCELFLDNIFIEDKTARQIIVSAYNKIERQQKEIEELKEKEKNLIFQLKDEEKELIEVTDKIREKNRIMELAELLDKQENEIKFMKGELEIQKGCSISKDKIREKIKEYDKWIKEGGDYTESLEAQRYTLKELLEEN